METKYPLGVLIPLKLFVLKTELSSVVLGGQSLELKGCCGGYMIVQPNRARSGANRDQLSTRICGPWLPPLMPKTPKGGVRPYGPRRPLVFKIIPSELELPFEVASF